MTASSTAVQMDTRGSQDPRRKPQLKFLWMELTRQCNLECTHCYEGSGPKLPLMGSMSIQDWVDVLNNASQLGVEMVQFIGGEPTLFPNLTHLIQTATELGIRVEVYTNGTVIKDALWEVFVDNNVSLAFSYYSNDAKEHEGVTTRTGSHAKTRSAISKAVELGLNIRVGVIQMNNVSNDRVNETLAELSSLGVENIGTDRVRGVGRGVVSLAAIRNPYKELCGACGDEKMAIDNNGQVYPCVFSKIAPLGHVSQGLDVLMRGPVIGDFLERLRKEHPVKPQPVENDGHSPCIPGGGCIPNDCRPNNNCRPTCRPGGDCNPQDCSP